MVWLWQLPLGTWRRPGQRHGSVTHSSRGVGCIFAHLLLEEFVGWQAFYLAQRLGYIFIAIHMTVWQEWKLPITDVKQWLFNDSVVPQWGCSGLCTLPPQFWHHSLSKECFDMSRFSAAIENILAFFFLSLFHSSCLPATGRSHHFFSEGMLLSKFLWQNLLEICCSSPS